MEIDFKNNAVKRGFEVVAYIDKVWDDIENRQEAVDKGEAGWKEDVKDYTLTIFFKRGKLKKEMIVMDKASWIWYKFFKRRNLGLE